MTSPGKLVTATGSVAQVGIHLDEGRAAFNRGAFFVAHESWEAAWHQLRGADRAAVQGLIQIAAGCHHLQQGRRGPGLRLLKKGLAKLLPNADSETTPGLLGAMDLRSLGAGVSRLLLNSSKAPSGAPDAAPDPADASVPDPHGLRL